MHLDVIDLRRFYYRTPLGRAAQRSLQEAIRALWPNVAGETVVGFGFAAPLLRPTLFCFRYNTRRPQQGLELSGSHPC